MAIFGNVGQMEAICYNKFLVIQHTYGWWAALTLTNGTKLGVNFFETLYPYEDKIKVKKNHPWTSELQASIHGRSGPSKA